MTLQWPIHRQTEDLGPAPDPMTPEWMKAALERNSAESMATAIMYWLSGRQFGYTEHVVRPCRQPLPGHQTRGPVTSYLLSWEGNGWVSFPCGCRGGCRVGGPRVVHLPGPVAEVTELRIGPTTFVAPELATMIKLEGNALYRVGGPWPPQDLGKPLGEDNTWAVKYQKGRPVPHGWGALTGLLAKEIETALHDDGECRLPRTVTTVNRKGVAYKVYDPAVIYAKGKTGIAEIDLVLAGVNPHHLMSAPSVI